MVVSGGPSWERPIFVQQASRIASCSDANHWPQEHATIWIVKDDEGGEANLFCTSGWNSDSAPKAGIIAGDDNIVGKMLKQKAPVRVFNPSGDPVLLGLSPDSLPIYSFLGGPIRSATHLYGGLCLRGKIGADQFKIGRAHV